MEKLHSSENQAKVGEFVDNEVVCCLSRIVDFIFQAESDGYDNVPFSIEDASNLYIDNSGEIEELKEELNDLEERHEQIQELIDECEEDSENEVEKLEGESSEIEKKIAEIEEAIDTLEDEDGTMCEVYEWWKVSSWLARRLARRGEVVILSENLWGRCTTGQAIKLDGVIIDICKEHNII